MMLQKLPEPEFNLFCLPFAGGSHYAYYPLSQAFAPHINVIALDLPGHGRRMQEPLLDEMHRMSTDLFEQMKAHLDRPYAIYGHSMGATLGYITACQLLKEGLPMPLCLFVSSRQGPTLANVEKKAHLLPKKEFIEHLISYGGIPEQILNEPDLLDLFEPVLRADFKAIVTYVHQKAPPLPFPIRVLLGTDDTTTYEQALKWQEVTQSQLKINQFPGNHFFIFNHLKEIKNFFREELQHLFYAMS